MKQLLLLAFLAVSTSAWAQNQIIVIGTILDPHQQPIPFAHVRYGNHTFTISDTAGHFTISVPANEPADTLKFSAMGFVTKNVTLKNYKQGQKLTIGMEPETFQIIGVTINNNKAQNHWIKALEKLQDNLPNVAYTYPALFRQVHQENGTYVRLIEAGITVYDVAATYQSAILQERFNFEQIRRSNVLERNGDAHGDHLVDMFLENSLRYPTGTVMDKKILNQFEISYDDSHCTNCGDSLELLTYHYEKGSDPKILDGKIWLYKGSMKLFAIEEKATFNPMYYERGMSFGSGDNHWMFKGSTKTLSFAYTNGKVYLSNLQFEYRHHIQDRTVGIIRYEVTESFNLYFGTPTLHPDGFVPDKSYARSGNLYSRKYVYEDSFWRKYSLAIENPIPNEVLQTFSSKVPLAEQFKRNGE